MKIVGTLLILFLLNLLKLTTQKLKISDVNILLPLCDSNNCPTVYYRVYAYGGCYDW